MCNDYVICVMSKNADLEIILRPRDLIYRMDIALF